jgi:urease accessory protein
MRRPGAMTARAVLASELAPDRLRSRVAVLRSDGPLVLRPCHSKGAEPLVHRSLDAARIALAAGTAGPLGGDDYALDVHVGAGSALVLTEISAMLILPGAGGDRSHMTIRVRVDDGATFVWWPEPIIAAAGCDHCHDVRIALAGTARMILREEMVLGRHGETPGDFTSRLRLIRDGKALYDQQLSFGPSADGWNGAAILGDAGAVGSVIAVNPGWASDMPAADPFHRNAALTPLPGPGVAVSAVAPDSLELRRLLTRGLNELGPPWAI